MSGISRALSSSSLALSGVRGNSPRQVPGHTDATEMRGLARVEECSRQGRSAELMGNPARWDLAPRAGWCVLKHAAPIGATPVGQDLAAARIGPPRPA